MGRSCSICIHPDRQWIDALIATGASDYEVARQFPVERISVGRHRRQHILAPMKDRMAIIAKDSEEKRQRRELAQAAASDEPSTQALVEATLGLRRQVEKLSAIEARLARMSDAAEQAGAAAAVAQLSAQQYRGIETGARLAGLRGFNPTSPAGQASEAKVFSISIHFAGSGRTEEINILDTGHSPTREAAANEDDGVVGGTTVTND
jgi:hypothetical protein